MPTSALENQRLPGDHPRDGEKATRRRRPPPAPRQASHRRSSPAMTYRISGSRPIAPAVQEHHLDPPSSPVEYPVSDATTRTPR